MKRIHVFASGLALAALVLLAIGAAVSPPPTLRAGSNVTITTNTPFDFTIAASGAAAPAGTALTNGFSFSVTGSNDFHIDATHVLYADGQASVGGLTNASVTANTLIVSDVNKKLSSIANPPANTWGQPIVFNGTNSWFAGPNIVTWTKYFTGQLGDWTNSTASGGIVYAAQVAPQYIRGQWMAIAPTNVLSYAGIGLDFSTGGEYQVFNNNELFWEALVLIDTLPTVLTNAFRAYIGVDSSGAGNAKLDTTLGAGYEFLIDTNSSNWRINTRDTGGGHGNVTNTTSTAVQVNTWTRLGMWWQSNTNTQIFYINGNPVLTNTTASTIVKQDVVTPLVGIQSWSSGGSTARINLRIAYFRWYANYGATLP